MSSSSSHNDNEKSIIINKQRLIDRLMGVNGLCSKYYHLKTNEGKTEFVFDIDDLKKALQEGGFEIKGFDKKPQLVKLLKKIQDEDGYIEVKGSKFILLEKGIEHCRQLYPTMP
ncbi:MAG: hypothetical protein ACJ72V_05730 [Nitrososphaeraceae archaeon]